MPKKRPAKSLLAKLKALPPTSFENLSFDLLTLSGLRNLAWRTPGVDGGRDLQGEHVFEDLSEEITLERWYVECKRYSTTVDWPTVAPKLAYAANHRAHYLLLITTAAISPRCQDEINIHNTRKEWPRIRVWPGHRLEQLVAQQPLLLTKYGLTQSADALRKAMLPLASRLSKLCQSAYAASATGQNPESAVEYAAALSELLAWHTATFEGTSPGIQQGVSATRDLYDWCDIHSGVSLSQFSSPGLRAVLSAYRFLTKAKRVALSPDPAGVLVGSKELDAPLQIHLQDLAPYCSLTISSRHNALLLYSRDTQQ